MNFRHSGRTPARTSGLSWNPEASVQIAVSYAGYNVVEVWDLRSHMAPKLKLEGGHQGGVVGVDWCPHDTDLLMTAGDDARNVVWNPNKGQVLAEYPQSGIVYDIKWNPNVPALVSTCANDNKVSIQSVQYTGPSHVPKWLGRGTNAAFGFGGRVVSAGVNMAEAEAVAPASAGKEPRSVNISQLVTEPLLLELAGEFKQSVGQGGYRALCQQRLGSAAGEEEKELWSFLSTLYLEPAQQVSRFLEQLGFQKEKASAAPAPEEAKPAAAPVESISEESFFDDLASKVEETKDVVPEVLGVFI
jgi:protein transport protein SEC31